MPKIHRGRLNSCICLLVHAAPSSGSSATHCAIRGFRLCAHSAVCLGDVGIASSIFSMAPNVTEPQGHPSKAHPNLPEQSQEQRERKRWRQQQGEYLTFIFSSRVVFQSWRRAVRGTAPPPAPSTSPGLSALFPRWGLGQESLGPSQGTGAERGPSCWQRGTAGQGHREMEAGLCCAMRRCAWCCAPG